MVLPRATCRISSRVWRMFSDFRETPEAPAANASRKSSCLSPTLNTSTGYPAASSRRTLSRGRDPSASDMSKATTSKTVCPPDKREFTVSARRTATTGTSAVLASNDAAAANPIRTASWSSTTPTFTTRRFKPAPSYCCPDSFDVSICLSLELRQTTRAEVEYHFERLKVWADGRVIICGDIQLCSGSP